jgi:hypothetical protein
VQILASALPGFRDLRAPLIAGYLWLVFLWILIKPDLHTRPANGAAGAVYDLAKDAGPIWIGLGVGVAVYLVGSVSQALSPLLGHKALFALWPRLLRLIANLLGHIGDKASGLRTRLLGIIAEPEKDLFQRYEWEAQRRLTSVPGKPRAVRVNPTYDEFLVRLSSARRGLDKELELPATVLLEKEPDPQLFSEADRLKAERELRLAVVPPLAFIFGFLVLNQSCWWWLAQIGVVILLWQGHSRNLEFRSVMIGAVDRGRARSRSIEELKQWVEALPEPASEVPEPSTCDAARGPRRPAACTPGRAGRPAVADRHVRLERGQRQVFRHAG